MRRFFLIFCLLALNLHSAWTAQPTLDSIVEKQKAAYQAQDWPKFFATAVFYRTRFFSPTLLSLEAMALAKHCQWSAANQVLDLGFILAKKSNADLTELNLAKKTIEETQELPAALPKTTAKALRDDRPYWKLDAGKLGRISNPESLRMVVKNVCNEASASPVAFSQTKLESDFENPRASELERARAAYLLAILTPEHTHKRRVEDYALQAYLKANVLQLDREQRKNLLRIAADAYFEAGKLSRAIPLYENLVSSTTSKSTPTDSKNPSSDSKTVDYANLKLGWIALNQNLPERAFEFFYPTWPKDAGRAVGEMTNPTLQYFLKLQALENQGRQEAFSGWVLGVNRHTDAAILENHRKIVAQTPAYEEIYQIVQAYPPNAFFSECAVLNWPAVLVTTGSVHPNIASALDRCREELTKSTADNLIKRGIELYHRLAQAKLLDRNLDNVRYSAVAKIFEDRQTGPEGLTRELLSAPEFYRGSVLPALVIERNPTLDSIFNTFSPSPISQSKIDKREMAAWMAAAEKIFLARFSHNGVGSDESFEFLKKYLTPTDAPRLWSLVAISHASPEVYEKIWTAFGSFSPYLKTLEKAGFFENTLVFLAAKKISETTVSGAPIGAQLVSLMSELQLDSPNLSKSAFRSATALGPRIQKDLTAISELEKAAHLVSERHYKKGLSAINQIAADTRVVRKAITQYHAHAWSIAAAEKNAKQKLAKTCDVLAAKIAEFQVQAKEVAQDLSNELSGLVASIAQWKQSIEVSREKI